MKRIVSAVLPLTMLVGCATAPMLASYAKNVDKVAVASTVTDTFELAWVGNTILSTKNARFPVPEWNISQESVTIAAGALSGFGRQGIAIGTFPEGTGIATLIAAARETDAQVLIIVSAQSGCDSDYCTQNPPGGFGLMHDRSAWRESDCVYISPSLHAYEIETGKHLSTEWAIPYRTGVHVDCYGMKGKGIQIAPASEWRDSRDQFSEDELEVFRQNILLSLHDNIPAALRRMRLGPR